MASRPAKKRSTKRASASKKGGSGAVDWRSRCGAPEIVSILLGGAGVLFLLAFISYSPSDLPDWVPFSSTKNVIEETNFIGPVGALVAGYAYFFFGAACFLIPAALYWWAFQVINSRRFLHSRNYFCLAIFLLAASCLIEYQTVLFQDWVKLYNLPKSAGGFFGHVVGRQILARFLGGPGAFIVMSMVYVIVLIIITGIHPFRFGLLAQKRLSHHWKTFSWKHTWQGLLNRNTKKKKQPKPRSRRVTVAGGGTPKQPTLKLPPREQQKEATEIKRSRPNPERVQKIIDASRSNIVPGQAPLSLRPEKRFANYQLPSLELLSYAEPPDDIDLDEQALIQLQNVIVHTLKSFNLDVEPGDITKGPTITRYEVYPVAGLRVNKITAVKADIARATRAEQINILAPIRGKDTVGIEIANTCKVTVALRELFEDDVFQKTTAKLPLVLGKDVYGKTIVADLAKMPHLLVAGATGSGKSVCINTIIASLLYRFTPDELKFIMIDPKVVEMQLYNELPHMVVPVVTDPKKVILALRWVINEMERRYTMFAKKSVRNFEGFNTLRAHELSDNQVPPVDGEEEFPESLPYIVVIIDELADLMQTAPADVETSIARIAQKARAAGIHLIVATQTPRAEVVTGTIKANIPSRIAFQVSSKMDSRIILDENGAENLVGKGDMLYLPPGTAQLIRAQGALITDHEAQRLVDSCSAQGAPDFDENAPAGDAFGFLENSANEEEISEADEEIIAKCMEVIFTEKKASTSLLQRRLRLGYTRAARMIDILEARGVIGAGDGAKPREILVDLSED